MKYVLLLMVITGLVLYLPSAYSDFSTNNKYLIDASGYLSGTKTIFDSTIALQLTMGTKSGSTMQSTLDNGLITIADAHYLILAHGRPQSCAMESILSYKEMHRM